MAAQKLNMELIPKLKAQISLLEDELIPSVKSGMENTAEICEESGSPKLISSCKSASEGVDAVVDTFKELNETLKVLLKYYEKAENAL